MRAVTSDQQLDMEALEQFVHEFKPSGEYIDVQPNELGHIRRSRLLDTLSPPSSNSDNTSDEAHQSAGPGSREQSKESADRRREIRAAQAAKRQLRYIKKIRTEREMLRQQEVELSALLNKLRSTQALSVVQAVNDLSVGAWKATAIHQKERRVQSEATQRRLKALVVDQSRMIHNMNKLLQQCLVQIPMASLKLHPSDVTTNVSLFKTFAQELDSLHAMTNEITAGVNFKLSSLPMQFELTRDWNYDMTFLESSDATIIPFGFDEACHALSLALLENSCERHRFDGVDDPENTAALTYHLDFSRELGDGATLVIHHVVRRYVEEDRVVFVWRALTEGQGTFKGLSTDETAWYVLRGTTDAGEGNAMVLEIYTRLMCVGFDLALDNDVRGNEFVKILIKADEEDADNITQIFARMLVDDVQTS